MPKITTVNSTEESILQITLFFFSCVTLKDLLRSNSILSLKFLKGNMEISLAMPKSSFGDKCIVSWPTLGAYCQHSDSTHSL